jgi:hypothetical protein
VSYFSGRGPLILEQKGTLLKYALFGPFIPAFSEILPVLGPLILIFGTVKQKPLDRQTSGAVLMKKGTSFLFSR